MAKGTGGWISTVLFAASWFAGPFAPLLLMASGIAAVAETHYQEAAARRRLQASFDKSGDNVAVGSPTYSWVGPQTISNPSMPVPLIYGSVKVGGNIVNSWAETVTIYQTKWVGFDPTIISASGFKSVIRTPANIRGVRVKSFKFDDRSGITVKVSYKKTGGSEWILYRNFNGDSNLKSDQEYIIINPGNYLDGYQWDIEIDIYNPWNLSSSWGTRAHQLFHNNYYGAEENTDNVDNVSGHHDYQYITLALAEGEISNISGEMLNDNLLSNYSPDYYDIEKRFGTNEQLSINWADIISTESTPNVELLYDTNSSAFTTQTTDAESVILIFSLPYGLYQIASGKYASWSIDLSIEYTLTSDGAWASSKTKTVTLNGKNANPFKYSAKIDIPQGAYKIRIKKTSPDPNTTGDPQTVGEIWWAGLLEYTSQAQSYPNTALAAVKLRATDQISGGLPQFTFLVDGKIVDVPLLTISSIEMTYENTYWDGTNYRLLGAEGGNAKDAICTDTGSFTRQFTRNPIWQIRDLCLSPVYGLGQYMTSMSDVDLRVLAKYCDELVDAGLGDGTTQKRFILDISVDSQSNAPSILESMLSTFRGFYVWSEGKLKLKIDKAENSVQLFTMGNIIEDSLTINYSSANDKYNAVKVQYVDSTPEGEFRLTDVMIYDTTSTAPTRIEEFTYTGITRRAQAVRMGRYLLNQTKYITESIQFRAGLDAIACEAGDVIEFAHDVTGYGIGSGRIKAATINTVTFDQQITLQSGPTYKIKVKLTDDTIEERTISEAPGSYYKVTIYPNFSSTPPIDSIYSVGETNKVTKPYRVLDVSRESSQERQITAIEYNSSIYSDTGDNVGTVVYTSLQNPLAIPESVTNLTAKEVIIDPGDGTKNIAIQVGWSPPSSITDPSTKPILTTATTGGSIAANTYYVKYTWVGKGGETLSSPSENITTTGATSTITVRVPFFPNYITSAKVYVSSTSGSEKYQNLISTTNGTVTLTTISGSGALVPTINTTSSDTNYDHGKVYLSENNGALWELKGEGRGSFLITNIYRVAYLVAVASVSKYGIAQNVSQAAKVSVSMLGDTTPPGDVTFIDANYLTTDDATYLTNSPEASYHTVNDNWNFIYGIKLRWTPVTDSDLAGYEIRKENDNWGIDNEHFIYRGMNTYLIYENPKVASYAFYVKAYDTSGNYSSNAGAISLSNSTPSLSEIYTDFTGKDCYLWWQEVQDTDFKEYHVFVYSDSGRTKLIRMERLANNEYYYTYEKNIQDNKYPGLRTLYFTIKALDVIGQTGTQNVVATNLPPDPPTKLQIIEFFGWTYLRWKESKDPDLKGYYVYVDDVQTQFVSQPSYRHNGDINTLYTYYVKATDTFGEGNRSLTIQGTPKGLSITPTDIEDFALGASKWNLKIPVLEQDGWTNNSPSAGYVAWNTHNLFYGGAKYVITAGSTNLKYIYWTGGTTYQASNTNPTLSNSQFIIATNVSGYHDLAWNAIANEVIGSAYLQKASIGDAHIDVLTVDVLSSGTINSQVITLAVTEGLGDTAIKAGKDDFGDTTNGFILGLDDSDSNKAKFEIGDANNWMKWNGSSLDIMSTVRKGAAEYGSTVAISDVSWTDIVTINFTTGGGDVMIWARAAFTTTIAPEQVQVRIYKGSDVIDADHLYIGTTGIYGTERTTQFGLLTGLAAGTYTFGLTALAVLTTGTIARGGSKIMVMEVGK
jgi:hypothetical protein